MKVTKEEFNEFLETMKLKYDAEFRVRLGFSECKNFLSNRNSFCFLLMSLCEKFKRNYELKLTDPKSGISNEITEKLTGIPKEKIIYIRKNYTELFNKFSGL